MVPVRPSLLPASSSVPAPSTIRPVVGDTPAIPASIRAVLFASATVIVLEVAEVYTQCAKALMRSRLWAGIEDAPNVPSAGDFVREVDEGFDGASYDAGYPDYAKERLW